MLLAEGKLNPELVVLVDGLGLPKENPVAFGTSTAGGVLGGAPNAKGVLVFGVSEGKPKANGDVVGLGASIVSKGLGASEDVPVPNNGFRASTDDPNNDFVDSVGAPNRLFGCSVAGVGAAPKSDLAASAGAPNGDFPSSVAGVGALVGAAETANAKLGIGVGALEGGTLEPKAELGTAESAKGSLFSLPNNAPVAMLGAVGPPNENGSLSWNTGFSASLLLDPNKDVVAGFGMLNMDADEAVTPLLGSAWVLMFSFSFSTRLKNPDFGASFFLSPSQKGLEESLMGAGGKRDDGVKIDGVSKGAAKVVVDATATAAGGVGVETNVNGEEIETRGAVAEVCTRAGLDAKKLGIGVALTKEGWEVRAPSAALSVGLRATEVASVELSSLRGGWAVMPNKDGAGVGVGDGFAEGVPNEKGKLAIGRSSGFVSSSTVGTGAGVFNSSSICWIPRAV